MPADDPRRAMLRERQARHAGAGDDADSPAQRQGPRVARDRVIGEPDLRRADCRADETTQPVALIGSGGRGGQPQHHAINRAEAAAAPPLADGVRNGGDGVALLVADPSDLHDAVTQGVAQPDAGLAAVHAQHAWQRTAASHAGGGAASPMRHTDVDSRRHAHGACLVDASFSATPGV